MRKFLIQKLLKKYKPRLVVVFGRYGREEARRAATVVLRKHSPVFGSSTENFFINLYEHMGGFLGIIAAFFSKRSFPHFCIIDTDPDNAVFGELRDLLEIDMALITAVGDIPSFKDVFAGAQKRSEKIIREARKANHIIYVYDDETIRGLVFDIPVSKKSYGFSEGANIQINNINNWIYVKQKASGGISLKVEREGALIPFNLINCYGKRNIYAASAALGMALYYNINFVSVSQDLAEYEAPEYSFALYDAIKSTALIAHTKYVTPFSAREGIEFLGAMRKTGDIRRLVIILGDILLRIHEKTEGLHMVLGELAAHNADELILIGERVIFSAEEAQKHGMDEGKIFHYHTVEKAVAELDKKIKKGDVILVLGSKDMNMERIVGELRSQ